MDDGVKFSTSGGVNAWNGKEDENNDNDTLVQSFQFYYPVTKVSESFEGETYPPAGWDIVNPDGFYTWQKTTDAAKTGAASVTMQNFSYEQNGTKDLIRLPLIDLSGADSAYIQGQLFYLNKKAASKLLSRQPVTLLA